MPAAPPSAAEASTALRPHGASTGSSRTYTSTRRCTTAPRQGERAGPHSWKSSLCTATHNWLCGQRLYNALVLRVRLLQLSAEEVSGPLFKNAVDRVTSMSDNGSYRTLGDVGIEESARCTVSAGHHQCCSARILHLRHFACTAQGMRGTRNEDSGMECLADADRP